MKTDRKAIKKYLLELIDLSNYDNIPAELSDNEKILQAMKICRAEAGHEESRHGTLAMVEYWFSGLCSAVSLPYLYTDIIAKAIEFGSLDSAENEKQAELICNNWFRYMSAQFLQMVRKAEKSA